MAWTKERVASVDGDDFFAVVRETGGDGTRPFGPCWIDMASRSMLSSAEAYRLARKQDRKREIVAKMEPIVGVAYCNVTIVSVENLDIFLDK